jgi:hypothetical protein
LKDFVGRTLELAFNQLLVEIFLHYPLLIIVESSLNNIARLWLKALLKEQANSFMH